MINLKTDSKMDSFSKCDQMARIRIGQFVFFTVDLK